MSLSPSTRGLRLLPLLGILGLAACAGTPPPVTRETGSARVPAHEPAPPAGASPGERAAAIAVRQLGAPYRYGGRSPAGFDCSGLVSFAYARAGRVVPRTTGGLWRALRPVARLNLEVGDVLFFDIEGKMLHVGLYLGDGRFVHAPSSGREVTIADLDSAFYRQAFIRGGRP